MSGSAGVMGRVGLVLALMPPLLVGCRRRAAPGPVASAAATRARGAVARATSPAVTSARAAGPRATSPAATSSRPAAPPGGAAAAPSAHGTRTASGEATAQPSPRPTRVRVLRPARLAGSWYSADPEALRRQLEGWLARAAADPERPAGELRAIIAPHAGYRFSGRTAAAAYRRLRAAKPRRVFVFGPSHHEHFEGAAVVPGTHFATPLGALELDTAARERLLRHPLVARRPSVDAREHSVEMQMPLLKAVAPEVRVVPLIIGFLTWDDLEQLARALRAEMRPGDLIVASSDFTHYGRRYGYLPFTDHIPERLRELDMGAWSLIAKADIAGLWRYKHRTEDTICGFYPISLALATLGPGHTAQRLRYDTSGALTGDYSFSVSYLAITFRGGPPPGPRGRTAGAEGLDPLRQGSERLTPVEQRMALALARETIARRLRHPGGPGFGPPGAGPDPGGGLARVRGVFVTLKRRADERLRGCIGSIIGREPLRAGIVRHALNAAFHDPRFPPLRAEELDRLWISISVLTPPHPVAGYQEIVLGRDGVILHKDGRSAVFLPQVAPEQGWDLRRTLEALARKAGVDDWRGARLSVFQAQVYDERLLADEKN